MTENITIITSAARSTRRIAGSVARRPPRWRAVLLAVAIGGGVASARADWLVLASGEAVETKGPWKVEGRMVIFTSTRGVLSSIRATSVDVDSSRALTEKKQEEATRVAVVEPQPRREPVLRLTDADFAPAPAAPVVEAAPAPGGGAAGSQSASSEPTVVPASDALETRIARQLPGTPSLLVMNWSVRPTAEDELSILGYVENVGGLVSAKVGITVTLYDSEGTEVGSVPGALSSTALMPGVQAFFEAKFPGAPNFASVEFRLSAVELQLRAAGDDSEVDGENEAPGAGAEQTAGEAPRQGAPPAEPPPESAEPEADAESLPEAEVREAPPPQTSRRSP